MQRGEAQAGALQPLAGRVLGHGHLPARPVQAVHLAGVEGHSQKCDQHH